MSNHNIQLKIQHKSLTINEKPREMYPSNYQTLTKQFKLLITTKQVPLDNFFTNFLLINSNSIKHTNSIDQI